MTVAAYARAANREHKIWPSFLYTAPFTDDQVQERVIIFGLYANTYLNLHNYLTDVEDNERQNLLDDYNTKIAGITNDDAILVAKIAAQRYVADIEKLIHDKKLETKELDIASDSAMVEAKIVALASDRKALETLNTKLDTERKITEARLKELEAAIDIEDVNLSLADIEVLEKNLELTKTTLRMLSVDIEIAKIQLAIVETGISLVEVDEQIAKTELATAQTEADIVRAGLSSGDLDVAQAQLAVEQAEKEVVAAEKAIVDARLASTTIELSEENDKLADITRLFTARENLLIAQNNARLAALDREERAVRSESDRKKNFAVLDITNADADAAIRTAQVTGDDRTTSAINFAAQAAYAAALYAAMKLAKAQVTSELTHTIGTAG